MSYTTRKSLLNGVHDGDEKAWLQFQSFYRPLMRICGHDYKLTEEEIQDLQQEVLYEVFKADIAGKFDSRKGRFRDYLRTIIQRKAFVILKQRMPSDIPAFVTDESIVSMDAQWEDEWRRFIMENALDELKDNVCEKIFMAYDLYVNKGLPPEKVADILQITPNQVYIAKTRCVQMLKEIVDRLKSDDSQ